MRNRDFAVVALGRFLVVERYRENCQSPSTSRLPGRGPAWTGGRADKPGSSSGSRAPARPEHG